MATNILNTIYPRIYSSFANIVKIVGICKDLVMESANEIGNILHCANPNIPTLMP